MESHVPTRSTCQKLQRSGVELDTELYWISPHDGSEPRVDKYYVDEPETNLPAPLLSELLEVIDLSKVKNGKLMIIKEDDDNKEFYFDGSENTHFVVDENPAEAACRLLIWLVDNNQINPDEL